MIEKKEERTIVLGGLVTISGPEEITQSYWIEFSKIFKNPPAITIMDMLPENIIYTITNIRCTGFTINFTKKSYPAQFRFIATE